LGEAAVQAIKMITIAEGAAVTARLLIRPDQAAAETAQAEIHQEVPEILIPETPRAAEAAADRETDNFEINLNNERTIMKTKIYITIILMATFSGCYTVLQHPDVPNQDAKGNVYHQNIYASDDCYSCHTERAEQTYDYDRYNDYYSNSLSGNEYSVRSRWDSYYSVPWWFSAPKVTVEAGKGSGSGSTTTNRTTSGSGSATRATGSTRSDVKINAPAATRSGGSTTSGSTGSGSGSSSSNTTSSGGSTGVRSSDRTTSGNDNNQGNSASRSGSSTTNDEKRNSGSNRGK